MLPLLAVNSWMTAEPEVGGFQRQVSRTPCLPVPIAIRVGRGVRSL
jgi:hypothetical protein